MPTFTPIYEQDLSNGLCYFDTIGLIEYDNSINDSGYTYSGLTLALDYSGFTEHFDTTGHTYSNVILNNDVYAYTGFTGETHYFEIQDLYSGATHQLFTGMTEEGIISGFTTSIVECTEILDGLTGTCCPTQQLLSTIPWVVITNTGGGTDNCDDYIARRTQKGWTLDFVFNKNGDTGWTESVFFFTGARDEYDPANYADNGLSFRFTNEGKIAWTSYRFSGYCNTISGYTEMYYISSGETLNALCSGGTSNDFNITITFERNNEYTDECDLANEGGWNDLIVSISGDTTEHLTKKWTDERNKRLGTLKIYHNGKLLPIKVPLSSISNFRNLPVYKVIGFEEIVLSNRGYQPFTHIVGGGVTGSEGIHEGICCYDIKYAAYFEDVMTFIDIHDRYVNTTSVNYDINECSYACVDEIYSLSPNGDPFNLDVEFGSPTVNLSWTIGSTNQDGHQIERSEDSGLTYSLIATVTGSTSTYTDTTIGDNFYRVRAYKGTKYSNYTNINFVMPFIAEMTITSSGQTITIPHRSLVEYTHDYVIDYGDNTGLLPVTGYSDDNCTHIYDVPGVYQVKIYGICNSFYVNNSGTAQLVITKIISWGKIGLRSISFYGCSNLTSISGTTYEGLSSLVTVINAFRNCTSLTSIPSDIFRYTTSISTFGSIFRGCTSITAIPENLFYYCPDVDGFIYSFASTMITSIPENLFANNSLIVDFTFTFFDTPITSIPSNLFSNNLDVSNFYGTFRECLSLTGNAPELWLRTSPTPTGVDCFYLDAGLNNYDWIPIAWGGLGLAPTPTPSITLSITPSLSISPTITPSLSISPTITPTITPSLSISITPSITPSVTPSIPETPTGLTATISGETQNYIELAWTNIDTLGAVVRVKRSTDSGSTYSTIAEVDFGVSSYSDTGITSGQTYYYKIVSFIGILESPDSNIVIVLEEDLWTPLYPLGGETPDFWYKTGTRTGTTLPDTINPGTGDASILLPIIRKGTSNTCYLTANTAADFTPDANGSITWCGWIKSNVNMHAAGQYLFYTAGFWVAAKVTTGYLFARVNNTIGGTFEIVSTTDIGSTDWFFLRLDINTQTNKFRFFINEVQEGSDADYTGTLGGLGYFWLMGGRAGSTPSPCYSSDWSDNWYFKRLLMPTEGATLMAKGVVSGAFCHLSLSDINVNDLSGNGNLFAWASTNRTVNYSSYGTRQSLEIGYTDYQKNSYPNIQIPFKDDGTELTSPLMETGYTKVNNVVGISEDHNLADSKILFADDKWNRTGTTIFNDLGRIAYSSYDNYFYVYDSTVPKGFHIRELDQLLVMNMKFDEEKGKCFINKTTILNDIFSYNTTKTETDLSTVLHYLNLDDIILSHHITYSLHSRHIWHRNGLKVLESSIADGKIYLSLDGGVTFPKEYYNSQFGDGVTFGHIFNNDTIVFATQEDILYSDDDLTSVHLCTVLDIDGNPFVHGSYENYKPFCLDKEIDGRPFVWGNYLNSTGQANVWYTIDSGHTIKSAYLFNDTGYTANHTHSVIYDSVHDYYWVLTGDDIGSANITRATYDIDTDTWEFLQIVGISAVGLTYFDGYFYWADDAGMLIRRCLYADIADTTKWEIIFISSNQMTTCQIDENGYLFSLVNSGTANKKQAVTSIDRINFKTTDLIATGNMNPALYHGLIGQNPKDSNGEYIVEEFIDGELLRRYQDGEVILVKINVP